jgi:predicted MFS family arabinose efflux permease
VAILYNLLFAPTFAVTLPVYVNEALGGAGQLGLLLAGFGVGTAVSTLIYGAIGHRLSRMPVLYGTLVLMTAGFWVLAGSQSFWQALAGLAIVGVAVGPNNALIATLIQVRVPEGMLGRVSALLFACSSLAAPLGVLFGGLLIEAAGFRVALLVSAAGITAGTAWVLAMPELRRMRDELEAAGREAPAGATD